MRCTIRFGVAESPAHEAETLEEQTFTITNVPEGGEEAAEAALYAGVEHLARGMRLYLEESDG